MYIGAVGLKQLAALIDKHDNVTKRTVFNLATLSISHAT